MKEGLRARIRVCEASQKRHHKLAGSRKTVFSRAFASHDHLRAKLPRQCRPVRVSSFLFLPRQRRICIPFSSRLSCGNPKSTESAKIAIMIVLTSPHRGQGFGETGQPPIPIELANSPAYKSFGLWLALSIIRPVCKCVSASVAVHVSLYPFRQPQCRCVGHNLSIRGREARTSGGLMIPPRGARDHGPTV
ncbi:unnamed protein product [Protopolystoma xenopodis]|uniref:Uncharacterized protein n=1 Tax=Protopolystoma xenopodis TaxID=117903 RepID=A0A448XN57_9PLAT|nr:unnamed protein product [Protopolystoma xenopodis]